ncbi:glycosyltransferase family 4 protein [Planctomycetota bacterium]
MIEATVKRRRSDSSLPPIRAIHVNTHDSRHGAARAAYRLHAGLRRVATDSRMLVLQRYGNDASVTSLSPSKSLFARGARLLRRRWIERALAAYEDTRPNKAGFFSDARCFWGGLTARQLPPCDVVNLHWIAGMVDYPTFFAEVPRTAPIVWTLHDMNPFTGGCHYSAGCRRFTSACGSCPQLGSNRKRDLSRLIWKLKRHSFRHVRGRLHVVTPSQWLAREASASSLLNRVPVSVIPYGLDVERFHPRDLDLARRAFEIPKGHAVVLFVADSLSDQRKGFQEFRQVLSALSDMRDLVLLSVGRGAPVTEQHFKSIALGSIDHDGLLSLAYSAADVFVIPSQQDNLPNTVLEAMACGTPVVGFDVGGIPDMVRPGDTGLLAPPGDATTLAAAIRRVLTDKALQSRMRQRTREIAVAEFSLEIQAERYLNLYGSLLG